MKKIFENFNKILITIIFLISCSEETILYDDIENREGTIKTASLPQINNKLYQSFPSFSSNSKLHFGNVKDSENLFSLVQMTLFSGNIPPITLVDLLADSIQVDSAMVFFQTSDSLQTDFTLGLYSVIADDDSVFSDSLNYYTKDNFIDYENNSMLLNTLNLSSEIVAPDTTGLDSIKFMFEADSGSLDLLKEYFLDSDTYPARTLMLKDEDGSLNELFTIESNESSNGPKMRVWFKAFVDEETTLDTFITFFSQADVSVFAPPAIEDDDFNYISLNSGSGLRSVIEFDLGIIDSLSRNELFKNSNLILDVENSNLNEDDEFYIIVSALQDSIENWGFSTPFVENEEELETISSDANFIISRKIEDNQVRIPIQAFLQGYKNGLFQHNELMLYSAPVNSPFDKVRLNFNAIQVMYVEP
jgi:hypothetical protein